MLKIILTLCCCLVICANCFTIHVDLVIKDERTKNPENNRRTLCCNPENPTNVPKAPDGNTYTNIAHKPKTPNDRNHRNFYFPKEDRNRPGPHEYHPATNELNKVHELRPTKNPTFNFQSTPRSSTKVNDASTNAKFTNKLQQTLTPQFALRNLIYSPISLQTILALVYLGAEDETAKQLQFVLELPESMTDVQYQFLRTLSEAQRVTPDLQLVLANKIYYRDQLSLHDQIKEAASQYFYSEISPISFMSPKIATKEINQWVADKTHNRIKDVIANGSLDSETEAILVNAIYMKANWAIPFSTMDTIKQQFRINNQQRTILVDMMYVEDDFRHGNFPRFDAQIVEMPFKDSELSMIIILPNKDDGLAAVENYLSKENLNDLLAEMEVKPLTLRLPKFKVEMEIDMVEPLRKLGITNIFSNNAQLGKFFSNNSNVRVSKIQHKAYINVNEAGIEAAASSFSQIVPLSLQPNMIQFTADHPFMFVIRSPRTVYFIGHVINNF